MSQGTQTVGGRDQQLSQLSEEIVKLTTFQTRLEAEAEAGPAEVSTASSLSKQAEYDSCEELEMINGAERLERDQSQELSSLSAKLREMEAKWETLYTQHQEVST